MAQPVSSRAGKMKAMNTRLGSQAASRGTISIFSRYSGSDDSSVTTKARQNAHGARRKSARTARRSNAADSRFDRGQAHCRKGR